MVDFLSIKIGRYLVVNVVIPIANIGVNEKMSEMVSEKSP
tara:strand:- start:1789 stop:1908 length:120 start_codon:yes stop_codon:yes gene_type:complete